MSGFKRFTCTIERPKPGKNALGDSVENWVTPAVSSHPNCRFYRKSSARFTGRSEGAAGDATPTTDYVLSVPDLNADIRVGDRFIDPYNRYSRVVAVRHYEDCLQCDVERGTVDLGAQP